MRLTLTVVDPLGGANADVVLDADPESSVGDIAKELAAHVGYSGGAQIIPIGHHGQHGQQAGSGGAPLAYVDGHPVDPASTIGTSPLREGAVVSLHDPAGCLPGEPTGLVELRVASGPAAARCTGSVSGGTTSAAAPPPTYGSTIPSFPPAR